jgi:hypothetical protein
MHVYTGVLELPPQKKKEYLGKCDNLNFKEKKVLSQAIIEKRPMGVEHHQSKMTWPVFRSSLSR